MTEIGTLRETTLNIQGMQTTEGRNGPEWKISGRWPWTPQANRHGDTVYVLRSQFPQWTADTKGSFPVLAKARNTKKRDPRKVEEDRGSEFYDGSHDWMWTWDVIKILDHEPAAYTPTTPSAQGNSYSEDRVNGQKWGGAMHDAATLAAPVLAALVTRPDELLGYEEALYQLTSMWYRINERGPEKADDNPPPERDWPSMVQKAVEDLTPPAMTGREAVAYITQMVKGWNAAHPDAQLTRSHVIDCLNTVYAVECTDFRVGINQLVAEQVEGLGEMIEDGTLAATYFAAPEEEQEPLPF